ncbi:MAG TPA: hypothetical protein P5522_10140, partial [Spirochaetia bacterium]|nr:hypothetical protein [Spirochaetia bacterium]
PKASKVYSNLPVLLLHPYPVKELIKPSSRFWSQTALHISARSRAFFTTCFDWWFKGPVARRFVPGKCNLPVRQWCYV